MPSRRDHLRQPVKRPKTYPHPSTSRILPPLSVWDASAERLSRGRGGARLRPTPYRAGVGRGAQLAPDSGAGIEAVQAWQQAARTPVAQRRFHVSGAQQL